MERIGAESRDLVMVCLDELTEKGLVKRKQQYPKSTGMSGLVTSYSSYLLSYLQPEIILLKIWSCLQEKMKLHNISLLSFVKKLLILSEFC